MTTALLTIVVAILGAALALIWTVAAAVRRSMEGLASEAWGLEPLDVDEQPEPLERAAEHADWADENGFEWDGLYSLVVPNNPAASLAVWRLPPGHTYFVCYLYGNQEFSEFVTVFDEQRKIAVSTSDSSASLLSRAKPPAFKQAFVGLSHDDRFARHHETVGTLAARWGITPKASSTPVAESIPRSVRGEARRIMATPGWSFRGVYGYFIGRHLAANRNARIPASAPFSITP
ncbi:MAG: hypothetical protein HND58_06465 [Planctomycetota bacterium]|nr:MAG: hypothetical protein HND58_06465 [Planctomycetota bacterium]